MVNDDSSENLCYSTVHSKVEVISVPVVAAAKVLIVYFLKKMLIEFAINTHNIRIEVSTETGKLTCYTIFVRIFVQLVSRL